MNKHKDNSNPLHLSLTGYITGFVMSLALTLTAYFLVRHHVATNHKFPPDNVMVAFLSALAISQLLVQLVYFLHLEKLSKKGWNLMVIMFAVIVGFIVVGGSLWIMYNLNYRMTKSPQQVNKYIQSQDGL